MNPINAIRFLRSIDFPCDPIASHDFFDAALPDQTAAIDDALRALRPTAIPYAINDYSDSDFDALDDALYPTD